MLQLKLLRKVLPILEKHKIDYMLTGSIVSSIQGAPRATHDVDVVVQVTTDSIPVLLNAFPPPQYYLSETGMKDSIERKNMFNLIDGTEGDKIDFWILTDEPFDTSRFARKQQGLFAGMQMKISSPEDTILKKLHWAKISGGSEKQFSDAMSVYEVQFGKLDMSYIESWVKKLGIENLWKKLKKKANPL